MKGRLYTVFYAAALGTVCAGLLTGVGRAVRPRVEANERAEEVRNILDVLGIDYDPDMRAEGLLRLFSDAVREGSYGDLRFYARLEGKRLTTVAFAVSGDGLWGPIKGFLALEPDLETVRGLTFHEQEETPGLGGEIGSEWFREQFRGKSIRAEVGPPGILIRRGGEASGPHEVDAISGATMTCDRVEDILGSLARRILGERDAVRSAIEAAAKEDGDDGR
jgi:Na+-transporting NADH:ubiquinone oxidoreductase subunit C